MKVYCALKFKIFGSDEQLVGIAKTREGALAILKREFPDMVETENGDLVSDANSTYLLDVQEVMVEN